MGKAGPSQTYDLVVSLGGNCSAAGNFMLRGLRRCSLPFDWLYMVDDRPVRWLAENLASDLSTFCLKANLVRMHPGDPDWPMTDPGKAKYRDSLTGYRFIHQFERPIETTDEYERVLPTLRRRVARFLDLLSRSKSVLLVLATSASVSDELLERLLSAFEKRFPRTHFHLSVLRFMVPGYIESPNAPRHPSPAIDIIETPRRINEYDFARTNVEWDFLDGVRVSEHLFATPPRPAYVRWIRKVVKWLLPYGLVKWMGKDAVDAKP